MAALFEGIKSSYNIFGVFYIMKSKESGSLLAALSSKLPTFALLVGENSPISGFTLPLGLNNGALESIYDYGVAPKVRFFLIIYCGC